MEKLFLIIEGNGSAEYFEEEFKRIKPNINATTTVYDSKNIIERTLLQQAVMFEHTDAIRLLLANKAKHKYTLHYALKHNKTKAFNALVNNLGIEFLISQINVRDPVIPQASVLQLLAMNTPAFFSRVLDLIPVPKLNEALLQSYSPMGSLNFFSGNSSGLAHIAGCQSFANIEKILTVCSPEAIYKSFKKSSHILTLADTVKNNIQLTPDQKQLVVQLYNKIITHYLESLHPLNREELFKAENKMRVAEKLKPFSKKENPFYELTDFKKNPPVFKNDKKDEKQHVARR